MKKFKFRYENILKMRLDLEEEVKGRLKRLNQDLKELEDQSMMMHDRQKQYLSELDERIHKGVKGYELKEISHFQNYFRSKIEEIDQAIETLNHKIETVKSELLEAVKERKIMEKIKEKDMKNYYDAANAAENKITDEIVNYQNSKRSGD